MPTSTQQRYFLADRSLRWFTVAASVLMTNLSTVQLIGLNGSSYAHGALFIAWELNAVLGLVIAARWFVPRYRATGAATLPEFVERHLGGRFRFGLALVLLATLTLVYLPTVLYSGSLVLCQIPGVYDLLNLKPENAVPVVSTCLMGMALLCLCGGGLRFLARLDVLAALVCGGFALAFVGAGLLQLGEGQLGTGLRRVFTSQPERWMPVGAARSPIPWTALLTGMWLINVQVWVTSQMVVQLSVSARSLAEAQRGLYAVAALKLFTPIIVILPGMIGYALLGPDLPSPDAVVPTLMRRVWPDWAQTGAIIGVVFLAVTSLNSNLLASIAIVTRDLAPGVPGLRRRPFALGIVAGILIAALVVVLASRLYASDAPFLAEMKRLNSVFNLFFLLLALACLRRLPPSPRGLLRAAISGCALYAGALLAIDARWLPPGVHWMHAFAACFAVSLVLTRPPRAPAPPPHPCLVRHDECLGETPWPLAPAISIGLVVTMLAIYVGLATVAHLTPPCP